jgi:hypothetical protein
LIESAVQIATIVALSEMLREYENSPDESKIAGMKIRRIAHGILLIVAGAARLDMVEMDWEQISELHAHEFAGVGV